MAQAAARDPKGLPATLRRISNVRKHRCDSRVSTGAKGFGRTNGRARPMSRLSGAEIVIKCLEAEGVDLIFGYPGGAVIDVYHELHQSSIRHILVRHEQAAVHAADGYARASGKVGVALGPSGPGATMPCTKHSFLVKDASDLVRCVSQAFHLARTGRPGPVVVDLPKDVMQARAEFTYPGQVRIEGYQ